MRWRSGHDEILRRLDAHMARGNELMARVDEHMARGNELMEANRDAFENLRVTLHQMTLRHEKVLGEMARNIADLTDETRAGRGALLRVLDRLDERGGAAGA